MDTDNQVRPRATSIFAALAGARHDPCVRVFLWLSLVVASIVFMTHFFNQYKPDIDDCYNNITVKDNTTNSNTDSCESLKNDMFPACVNICVIALVLLLPSKRGPARITMNMGRAESLV